MKCLWISAMVIVLIAPLSASAQSVEELAGRLSDPAAADAVFKLAGKGQEAVPVLTGALSSTDENVRYHALWALTITEGKVDSSVFAGMLDDKNPLIRLRALFGLSAKAPGQASPILGRLASDPDWLVRGAAATVLADFREPAVTEALLKSLEMHENRFSAVALVSHGKAAAPGLRELVKAESSTVRQMACFALGRIGDSDSLDALSAAAKDQDPDVAVSASVALALMRQDEAFSLLQAALSRRGQSEREIPAIMKKLVTAINKLEQLKAGEALTVYSELGKYGFLPPVPELVSRLRSGGESARRAAATALGEIGTDLGLSALAEASGDSDPELRLAAAVALGRIAAREGVAPLRQLSYDPDPRVRAAAAAALAKLDISDLSPIFKRMSSDRSGDVRRAAIEGLDIYPPSFTEPVFISLLKKEKDPRVSALLVELLGRIGTENALNIILSKLDAKEAVVRCAAIEALENFKDARVEQRMVAVLKKAGSVDEKAAAVRVLGASGGELAEPVLAGMMQKPGDELGPVVAEALGNLGAKDAVPVLTKALEGAGEVFAESILIALGKIGAPESLPRVIAVARDRGKPVEMRRAAATALGGFAGDDTAKAAAMGLLADDAVAAEAALVLHAMGDESGLAVLGRLLRKTDANDRLRAVNVLRRIDGMQATVFLLAAARDEDLEVALTAALELILRDQPEAIALLHVLLSKEEAGKKLRELLGKFEAAQVLLPVMEKLAAAGPLAGKIAIVDVLGQMEITDFRIPKDASSAEYEKLIRLWLRWWEATTGKLPSGAGRIRSEEGETEKGRRGALRGLEWIRKKK